MRPALLLLLLCACATPKPPPSTPARPRTLSIVGTNDLHGAITRLPIYAGYVANLRAARAADGGAVVLVDGGDMFQGTLESNLGEGAAVIEAYNQIGVAAAAIGNHEFDFGPPGPAATVRAPGEDPRGALKARAAEARFPLLAANVGDSATGARVDWPNMPASVMVEAAGIKVGIVGVTTEGTPLTTMPANFVGLKVIPPAEAIAREARALREAGAGVVVVAAHLGSRCSDFKDPDDLTSCDRSGEIFEAAEALPAGLVDVIVAGHIHLGMAHRVNGIAIIESFASGRAFGRVDLSLDAGGRVVSSTIHPPRDMCQKPEEGKKVAAADCKPGDYEGRPVTPDPAVSAIVDKALAQADKLRHEPLGLTLAAPFLRSYGEESAVGNLFTDLMLRARPDAQLSMVNGGSLRADLPAGPLTYGSLYEAMPFDNRFAIVKLNGGHLRSMILHNLQVTTGLLSFSGMTSQATCKDGKLTVTMRDRAGKVIEDSRAMTMVTSDFLGSGGDGAIGRLGLPEGSVASTDVIIRDAMADELRRAGKAELLPTDHFDPKKPRAQLPGKRPLSCP